MLGKKIGHILVATDDTEGLPHVAAAAQMDVKSEDEVEVSEWFCPGTVANVEANPRVAILVWDAKRDNGYQLLGTVEKVEEGAIRNRVLPPPPAESSGAGKTGGITMENNPLLTIQELGQSIWQDYIRTDLE